MHIMQVFGNVSWSIGSFLNFRPSTAVNFQGMTWNAYRAGTDSPPGEGGFAAQANASGGPLGGQPGRGGAQKPGEPPKGPPAGAASFGRWAFGARGPLRADYGTPPCGPSTGGAHGGPGNLVGHWYGTGCRVCIPQEEPVATVPPLDLTIRCDDDWVTWACAMEEFLSEEGLLHTIQSDRFGEREDIVARACLVGAVSKESQVLVDWFTNDSAYRLWQYLIKTCTELSKLKVLDRESQLLHLTMKQGEEPSAYVGRAKALANSIRRFGGAYSELGLCFSILRGLPDEDAFNGVAQRWMMCFDADVNTLEADLASCSNGRRL